MCSIIQWHTKRKPFDSLVKWLPTARPLNSSHFNLFWGSGGLHYKKTQFVFASSLMANMSVLTNTSEDRSSSRKYQWSYLFMVAQVSLLLTVLIVFVLCEFTKENCVEMAELASCVRGMQLWTSQLEILINITLSTQLVLEMNYVSMQTAWFYSPRT